MSLKLTIVLFSAFLMFASCSAGTTQSTANRSQTAVETSTPISASASPTNQPGIPLATADASAAKPRVDACALLTSREIEAVQGEAVKETKLSGQSAGGFSLSQCFFTLPTFTNSVSLQVTQMGEGAGAKHPKEFWRDTFHGEKRTEKNNDRDKKRGEEEDEEQTRPQKVLGIGDEAYWTGSRVGGALHVLKGNSYIRIGLGGPSDQATKIKKSKALAEKAIARL
jgi:hypothetical protein